MRYFSPTMFAAVFVFFALPFGAVVSCEGTQEVSWTGYQLVTKDVQNHSGFGYQVEDIEDKSLYALPVLASALAGFLLGIFYERRYAGWAAFTGLGSTLLLQFEVQSEPRVGFLLTLLAFLSLGLAHGVSALHRRYRESRGPPEETSET